ncbi:T-cell surface glycoprotein CD4 [Sorex fumeus]|uniref:T-cell surface glycoprotein CD4 n=1 Tax=Sorex fumeus TaxID=62283 RepID=UPI0024ADE279|nr:T-cell surface glycoprotein CD4 [Sorex fumeus]
MNWGPPLGCLLLGLQLALLRVQGSEVVLAGAGDSAELPCKGPPKSQFTWKLQPHDTPILKSQRNMVLRGLTRLESRVDSRTREWNLGSFPLVISKLKLEDSGTYICEVKDQKTLAVELQVYKLTASSDTTLLFQGQSLNLTLQGPPKLTPSVQWQRPGSPSAQPGGLAFFVAHVQMQDSGLWTCTVSHTQKTQKTLKLQVNILVLGFQKAPYTVYARENQSAQFTFPLNSQVDALTGELSWQGGGAPSAPQPLITFSFKEKKLSFQQVSKAPKLQMEETLPLNFTLPRALPRYAGTFKLDLCLLRRPLSQEVKLVVMRVTTTQSNVTCEVSGPVPPSLTLRLRWRNQTKASSQQSLVKVQDAEAGTWQCELMGAAGLLLMSAVEVSSTDLPTSPMNLVMVVGGLVGFLLLTSFCIYCCVRCQHRRRQAQRMSQIKRLLSERKTCQCSHRLQKTRGLL